MADDRRRDGEDGSQVLQPGRSPRIVRSAEESQEEARPRLNRKKRRWALLLLSSSTSPFDLTAIRDDSSVEKEKKSPSVVVHLDICAISSCKVKQVNAIRAIMRETCGVF